MVHETIIFKLKGTVVGGSWGMEGMQTMFWCFKKHGSVLTHLPLKYNGKIFAKNMIKEKCL